MSSKEVVKQQIESPIIGRPEDPELIEKLSTKSREYKERLMGGNEYSHPAKILAEAASANNSGALDAYLKFTLLDEVLEQGVVDTWDFQERMAVNPDLELSARLRPEMFVDRMQNACAVINSYFTQELSQLQGGTGI